MPYEIARAYDEDKNLVPLYVLYDGEIPEVSPGFSIGVSKYGSGNKNILISIVANSSNPAGGTVSEEGCVGNIPFGGKEVKIKNNSDFTIIVSGNLSYQEEKNPANGYAGEVCSFGDITLSPDAESSPVTTSSPNGSGWSASYYGYNFAIQRVRS